MLDQNTDRSWFMIGAVIIGCVICGAAYIIFPQLFHDIGTKLTGLIDKVPDPAPAGFAAGIPNFVAGIL